MGLCGTGASGGPRRYSDPPRPSGDPRRFSWITELVITYDARPSYTVSIMEFRDGKVARETQYFGDPFEPGAFACSMGRADALKASRHKGDHPPLSRAELPVDTVSLAPQGDIVIDL
jgi:hypothetical protein